MAISIKERKKRGYDPTKDYELLRVLDLGLPNVSTIIVVQEHERDR